MVGNGKVKSILLLALGFAVIALAGPAAGDTGDHCLDKETCMVLQQSSMGDCQLNGTLTCCMIDENMSNESCYMAGIGQNATVQARLNCTDYWLAKAIELHELNMKNPSTATNESQMELMDYLMPQGCIYLRNQSWKRELLNTPRRRSGQLLPLLLFLNLFLL